MEKISREEYDKRLRDFVREQRETAEIKPQGFHDSWAFHLQMERKFKKKLEADQVVVEK